MTVRETNKIAKGIRSETQPTDAFARGSKRTAKIRTVRRMRRIGGSRRPFFPYGFIPLVGLTLLFPFGWIPFAYAAIQRDVAETARKALDGVGADWATASVDGQWVLLGGLPPSREAADKAYEAVRTARVQTLFGKAYPVTRLETRFLWPAPAAQPAAPAPASANPTTSEPIPVSPIPTTPAPVTVAPAPPPSCDQVLAGLLGQSRIEFASASAAINPESSALLGEIATAVASCPPGKLRIEGHTDNVGSAQANTALSRQRAESVRAALIQRGIAADRLVAEGFGADRPVADNGAEDGRARNRRIEIRMIPPT